MIRRGLSILLTLALVLALALSAGAAGTPTVRIETPENVKAGESFYFSANKKHSIANMGGIRARLIWVSTPPTF